MILYAEDTGFSSAMELYMLGEYELLSENPEEAEKLFKEALDIDSTSITLLTSIADLCIDRKEYEKAIPFYRKASFIEPDNYLLTDYLINLYAIMDDLDEAESYLSIMTDNNPHNDKFYVLMGEILYLKQDWIGLINNYADLHIIDDPDGKYLSSMLEIGIKSGEYDAIMNNLEKIFINDPSDTFAVSTYIQLLYIMGDNERILDGLLRLNSLDSNNRLILQQLALFFEDTKKYIEADSISQILVGDGTDATSLNNYAYNLSTRENISEDLLNYALDLVVKAIDYDPNNAAFLDTIGWIYFKLGMFHLSQHFVQYSLDIDGNNTVVIEHLGDVYIKLDQLRNAAILFERSLSLNPENIVLKNKYQELMQNIEPNE